MAYGPGWFLLIWLIVWMSRRERRGSFDLNTSPPTYKLLFVSDEQIVSLIISNAIMNVYKLINRLWLHRDLNAPCMKPFIFKVACCSSSNTCTSQCLQSQIKTLSGLISFHVRIVFMPDWGNPISHPIEKFHFYPMISDCNLDNSIPIELVWKKVRS